MFDKKKIELNHVRASKQSNKKAINYFMNLSNILIERAELDKNDYYKFLEASARSNILFEQLKHQNFKSTIYQTIVSNSVLINNKNRIVSNLDAQIFKKNFFDVCFCIFSLNGSENLPLFFKNIFEVLKNKGKFLAVIPAEECLKEFRDFFLNYFKIKTNKSFMPYINIQTLGNLGTISGFKNVIVDKELFNLEVLVPADIWSFIRAIGESNYLLDRTEKKINKDLFTNFCGTYSDAIKKGQLKNNTFSLNFFIGNK